MRRQRMAKIAMAAGILLPTAVFGWFVSGALLDLFGPLGLLIYVVLCFPLGLALGTVCSRIERTWERLRRWLDRRAERRRIEHQLRAVGFPARVARAYAPLIQATMTWMDTVSPVPHPAGHRDVTVSMAQADGEGELTADELRRVRRLLDYD